ncbi:ABC transporter permease, partial [Sphingomonas bacterium]|uniref:ABC transporter permease n=1 Tax=Sphingomonas bacterium TaxID=1895847 RepID=UPI001575B8EF
MSALAALYRSISRHPLYSALNIGGLALGIAVFLVLSLFVRHEQSFNRFPGAERLWVMQERYDAPGRPAIDSPHVMGGELDLLRHDFPGLVGARWSAIGGTILRDGEASTENLVLIDPAFLPLFDYSVVAGDAARTLTAPDGVVISQRMARRYFGERSPIGRPLTLMIGRLTQAFTVGAVVADAPRSTEFNGSLFVRMTRDRVEAAAYDHWNVAVGWTFLRFPDADAAHRFEAGLPAFLGRHAFPTGEVKRAEYRQSLRPLAAIHLFLNGERETVATLQVVGALTLLIAIVNYVNLATARAGLRAREVAMRKVLGATRRALIGQFLGEALATVALAALIGLALAELVLPFVNALGGTELAIDYVGANGIVVPLALLVLVVGLAAGTYPALLLSRFQPAAVLASVRAPGGGRAGA